jgi:oligopeptide/dipeptide ABC transporter ATP-binding protein
MDPLTAPAPPLLSIKQLSVGFNTPKGLAYAVNNLSLDIAEGSVFGLVGESGCGKSMTSLAILRLLPTAGNITQGSISLDGRNLLSLPENDMRRLRGSQIALIPQDPLTALNPVYTIGNQLNEVLRLHQGLSNASATKRSIQLLDQVRLPNAKNRLNDYPHQFSGGMRQRVMIAMALSCSPRLLIADEPTTALDVTIQAQILALLKEIQADHPMSILMITHDLGVVAEICDDVAVMYAGRVVEQAPTDSLFATPQHPYTQGLLNAIPQPIDYTQANWASSKRRLVPIVGQPPALTDLPTGCLFAPRCPKVIEACTATSPALASVAPKHQAACVLV